MTTWTPQQPPNASWTAIKAFVFSPLVFAAKPVFDSESSSQAWNKKSQPTGTWTAA